jgi:hypothetical protein
MTYAPLFALAEQRPRRGVMAQASTLDNVHIEGVWLARLRCHRKASSPPHKLVGTRLSCPLCASKRVGQKDIP